MLNEKLKQNLRESFASVMPITVIVLLLSVTLVPMEIGTLSLFLMSAVLLMVGMGFFQLGAEMAMTPLGQGLGSQLAKNRRLWVSMLICFAVGAVITLSEPDLQVLAEQVASIPNQVLIWTVAVGVGGFLVIAVLRIVFHISLPVLLGAFYGALFVLAFLTPDAFVAVAVGVGLSAARSDREGASDSFGLIALCSIGPVLMVLLLGIFYHPEEATYTAVVIPEVATSRDVFHIFLRALPNYAREVLLSTAPVLGVFALFQAIGRKYRRNQVLKMCVGFLYTEVGLILFLTGVNVGFAPVGNLLGLKLAEGWTRWLLIPTGLVIGYYIVKAEPAVQVLNHQVEEITGGAISHKMMNMSLSIGVACAVGLSMVRVLTGMSIYWIIIPGYVLALMMTRFVPPIFVGVAFDSGGVASGPMTSTFLLPLAMGACTAVGGNVVTDAFGVVALVALTPLIAIQVMGLVYVRKNRGQAASTIEPDDEIVLMPEEEDE